MKISTTVKFTSLTLMSIGPSQAAGTALLGLVLIKAIKDAAFKAYYSLWLKWTNASFYRERVTLYSQAVKHDCKIADLFCKLCVPLIGLHLVEKEGDRGFQAIGKEVASNWLMQRGISSLVRTGAFPLNRPRLGNVWRDYMDWPKGEMIQHLPCREMELKTADGRKIQALWSPSDNPKDPVAILFHGNAMTASAFGFEAGQFKRMGFQVLMITLGGYPDSSPHTMTTEATVYHDAHAAVAFVKEQTQLPHERLLAYGLSLGGAPALEAGAAFPGTGVVTNQTFAKMGLVPYHMAPKWIGAFAKGALTEIFKKEKPVGSRFTDGFNNIKKVQEVTGPYFAIQTLQDELMTKKGGGNQTEDLVAAYVKAQKNRGLRADSKEHLFSYHGRHGACIWHSKDGREALEGFLMQFKR